VKKKILLTGGSGLIGTNLKKSLLKKYIVKSIGSEIDLRNESKVKNLFSSFKPNILVHLAARVGGIQANMNDKLGFYLDNTLINTNVIKFAEINNIEYIFAMGTGCAYPKKFEKEILNEDMFLDGIPEKTNDAYAYAKRNLLVHLQYLYQDKNIPYCYCIPSNIFGPHDNFHPLNSHVIPGLIKKIYQSKKNKKKIHEIWGTGNAKRDFLYIDDLVVAIEKIISNKIFGSVNIASNKLTSIRDAANIISKSIKYNGKLIFSADKPEGQLQRKFDISKINKTGWKNKTKFYNGIKKTIKWFLNNQNKLREK